MLQSWHALKLQLGQKRPSGGAGRAAPCAASPGCWKLPLPQLAALSRGGTSAPGLRPWALSSGETPSPAHFASARVWGMRAWWLQVAAEQLPVGEPGDARRRQPRPEVSAAEVCVDFPAAPPERVGGTCPPLVL